MNSNDLFDTAVKLREVHETMRRFYGVAGFEQQVKIIGPLIEKAANLQNVCIYTAAIRWANEADCPDTLRPLILAVAAEIRLRHVAELQQGGRS